MFDFIDERVYEVRTDFVCWVACKISTFHPKTTYKAVCQMITYYAYFFKTVSNGCQKDVFYGDGAITVNIFALIFNSLLFLLLRLSNYHWLPLPYRIQFKPLCFVFKYLQGTAPSFLIDLSLLSPPWAALTGLRPVGGPKH